MAAERYRSKCSLRALGFYPAEFLAKWKLWLSGLTALLLGVLPVLSGCRSSSTTAPREVSIQQAWELEPGDVVAGYMVTASLGDISIQLNGDAVRAPFSGEVELAANAAECIYFSTPEVPAYLFRFCGLKRPRLGPIPLGNVIGTGRMVHFATLRRQPDGTWAIVEPSNSVLERALQPIVR